MIAKLDIVLHTAAEAQNIDWSYGSVIDWQNFIAGKQFPSSSYVLFWDALFGPPDINLLEELMQKPVDAWHSGLKNGLQGLPSVMNCVDPTWMYNIDASDEVVHTNFRLSLRCALVKTGLLNDLHKVMDAFSSIEMMGIALGYAILKAGGIIRYHPLLSPVTTQVGVVTLADEWVFARKFYSAKWLGWILLNHGNTIQNLRAAYNTRNIKRYSIKPCIHESNRIKGTSPETVSVLAPTLKRYEYLIRELEQLEQQTILPLEVLITDQTPAEERQILDTTKYPDLTVRYFIQSETGQCIAWNKLLEEAKGEYVLFLGDDADHITPDFIEKLLSTLKEFDADMVASNVIEVGSKEQPIEHYYHLAGTFPITLIKRKLLLRTGFMDMFFNKNIRADHDLAMRCHLEGALMIFNPSATIHHHRAMTGGLRTHKARVVTNSIVKQSLTKFTVPTSSEIYLTKKYYSPYQYKKYIGIKFLNQLFIAGGIHKKFFKLLALAVQSPRLYNKYIIHRKLADEQLSKNR
jgi:glycosyltransferase involved in cell wall biosynthesis